MKSFEKRVSLESKKPIELVNISASLSRALEESGIKEGIMVIFNPHTTAALIINEDESRLVRDFEKALKDLVPWEAPYEHNQIDDNAPAHLVGAFLGADLNLHISQGKLLLGTWQSVFFAELDGPRSRKVLVKILGE